MRKPGVARSPQQQDRAPCRRKPQDFPALGGLVLGPAALTPPRGLAEKCNPARQGLVQIQSCSFLCSQVELVATIMGDTWKLGVRAQPRSSTILSVLLGYNSCYSKILRTSQPVPRDLAKLLDVLESGMIILLETLITRDRAIAHLIPSLFSNGNEPDWLTYGYRAGQNNYNQTQTQV